MMANEKLGQSNRKPNHAERAEGHIQAAIATGVSRPVAQASIAMAQIEATLAVAAEQKRIADWLEAWPLAHDESPVVSVNGVG